MSVSIATFNVNSIRARLPNVLAWLAESKPDIALLQELKCMDDQFPALEIEELGYNCAVYGEKTYNGVAILSKFPLEDISRGIPEPLRESVDERAISPRSGASCESQETFAEAFKAQARYIEALAHSPLGVLRVASVYVPNGQEVGSDKFAYKLRFLERLREHMRTLLAYEELTIIGGDYNVAPEAHDVYDAKRLDGSVCFHPEERMRLRAILHEGYTDAFRQVQPDAHEFSWWDYRGSGFEHNLGLRIDHLLLSPQAADKLSDCSIERPLRGKEKASDHAPVIATFG